MTSKPSFWRAAHSRLAVKSGLMPAPSVDRGYIDYGTWLAAMLDWRQLQASEEWNTWIEAAFQRFQKEGRIGKEELSRMLGANGVEVRQTLPRKLPPPACPAIPPDMLRQQQAAPRSPPSGSSLLGFPALGRL